jgi:branched-chain amino acid transport system substrate-binding protein
MKKAFATVLGIDALCLVLLMALTAATTSRAFAVDTVKIGLLEPLSGPAESVGRFYKAAAEFAIDEQNAKGGLVGKKIELFVEDCEMKVDVGLRKAKKLILEDKVNFLGVGTDESLAIALNKLIPEYKVIQIDYGTQALELTGKEFSPYTFRTTQDLHNLVAGMALTARSKGFKRFYNIGLDILPAHEHVQIFKEQLKKMIPDSQVVGEDYFPWANKDFGPYITKIKAAKPDIIMVGAFGPDVINLIKQTRKMGLKTPFLNHAAIDPYFEKALGEEAANLYYSIGYSMEVKTPENADLIKKWHEKHKNDKDFYLWWPFGQVGQALLGWRMTFAAIEKAGSLDPEKIIQAYEGFEYKTPVGLWTMRKCDHQVIKPMFGGVMQCGPNPYFNGSISPDVKFCWESPNIMTFPAEKVMNPATPDYNARCK